MSSTQVLPIIEDPKQKSLEMGRKKLDEFRKKKAGRAKKSVSTAEHKSTHVSQHVAHTQESISSAELSAAAVQRNAGFTSTSASGNTSSSYNEVGYSVPSTSSLAESFTRSSTEQSNGFMKFDSGQTKISNSITQEPSADSTHWKSSDSLSSGFTSRNRNRTSFLDSLNLQRDPSVPSFSFTKSESSEPFFSRSSKGYSTDIQASSASGHSLMNNKTIGSSDMLGTPHDMYERGNYSVAMNNENGILSQGVQDSAMKWSHDFPTVKQDENFSALEQHIEDLTQEKFSLTRALEASRVLSESLAAENSSLTDSYNQQRNAVNQLKSEMESLQEEIKSQLLELESFKMEYSNTQLECNAADERAKILASEVIVLEEKALKLRSRELKLERQLEESNAEIASYKKKVSNLQKERQDLQSTIDALQEEKKLLQSKVRKSAGNDKSVEVVKTPSDVKSVSTSTEDLDFEVSNMVRDVYSDADTVQNTSNHDMQHDAFPSSTSSTFQLLSEDRQFYFPVASAAIPHDQLRMIGNINSLISELALEKEELVQSLSSESSLSSKLKELNNELSRKLEAQTQRLELLTAQSMANENIQNRPTDPTRMQDSIAYTDEGDEVVERVLGWIMKLFPGGPSKRRTRRLL
ncbi:Blister-like protein [Thalictrum thalictroides]|uniref:Blister-like protein n=1 Tax=Thalictrum thalictroides TaxID=46969 RepID=A0A7J6VSG5_THATH|nr:Blister-like protein [Thalictrum thalictroides]